MADADCDKMLKQLDAAIATMCAAVERERDLFHGGYDFLEPENDPKKGPLPLAEACRHAQVSLRTAQRYICRGVLPVLAERPNQRGHASKIVDADVLRTLAESHKVNRANSKLKHPFQDELFPSSTASVGPMRRFQRQCARARVCPFTTLDLLLRGCSPDLDMLATAIRWIVSPVSVFNSTIALLPLLHSRKVESTSKYYFERAFARLIRKRAGTAHSKPKKCADFSTHWKDARGQVALEYVTGTWSINARPELGFDWDRRKARLQMVPTWLDHLRKRNILRRSSMSLAMTSIVPRSTRGPITKILSEIASLVWPTGKDGKPCRDENAAERLRSLMANARYSVDSGGQFIFDGEHATSAKCELKALFREHHDRDRYVSQVVSAIAYRYNIWRPTIRRALINRVFCMNRSNSLPRPPKPRRRVSKASERLSLSDEVDDIFAFEQSKASSHANY